MLEVRFREYFLIEIIVLVWTVIRSWLVELCCLFGVDSRNTAGAINDAVTNWTLLRSGKQ